MTYLSYTDEELEFLRDKVSTVLAYLAKSSTPYLLTSEEYSFLYYFGRIVRTEYITWSANETFNDNNVPKDLTILTDPLWKMPLRINDDSLIMRTIAAGRLEIAK